MGAREELIAWIGDSVSRRRAEQVADGVLAQHARELAEKIRNSPELRDLTDDHMSDCNAAADLIDPGA